MKRNPAAFLLVLELFKRQNPAFSEKLQKCDPSFLIFCETEGELNLSDGEKYFHDPSGAHIEAERWLASLPSLENTETLYLYGIGLGYYYLQLKSWLEQRSDRLLFIFEDDPAVLLRFFEVDIAEELLKNPQVILIPFSRDNIEEILLFFQEINLVVAASVNTRILFSALEYYRQKKNEICANLSIALEQRMEELKMNLSFTEEKLFNSLMDNIYRNVFTLPQAFQGNHFFEQFKKIPMIICGAGPSITSQMESIKLLKNKALIFGAGTGMNILNAYGINPHFGCGIDPHATSKSRIMTNTAYETPYFFIMQYNHSALDFIHGPKLWFRNIDGFGFADWLFDALDIESQDPLQIVISTTCGCLALADKLGACPIILVGLDLSYTDKKRYPDVVRAHPSDIVNEKLYVQYLKKEQMIPTQSIQGHRIFTRSDWLNEGAFYMLFSAKHPDIQIFNATVEGLSMAGLPHVKLTDLQEHLPLSFDLENWVHATTVLSPPFPLEAQNARNVLLDWKMLLEEAVDRLIELIKELTLENKQIVSEELKNAESYKYFLKNFDKTFELYAARDRLRHERHSEHFTAQELADQKRKHSLMKWTMCLGVAKNQIEMLDQILKEEKEKKQEAETLYQEPKIPPDYSFEKGRLRIEAPEIGLYFDEVFEPASASHLSKIPGSYVFEKKNEIAEGECLLYDREGWLKGRWYYKAGKLHGPSTFYTREGNILARGWFIEDLQVGINRQFYASGKLYSLKRFKEGEPHGLQEYFYENGLLKSHLEYSRGYLNGIVQLYYPNGVMKREIPFANGKIHGKERLWTDNGVLIMESEFTMGEATGKTMTWSKEGLPESEIIFYDSEEHFDEKRWDAQGNLIYRSDYFPQGLSSKALQAQESVTESAHKLKERLEAMRAAREKGAT